MIGKIKRIVGSFRVSYSSGFAQIPLIIGLLLMAVAIPAATKLVQQSSDTRNLAAGNCPAEHRPGGCGNSDCCRTYEVYENGCCHSTSGCNSHSDCSGGKQCINHVCQGAVAPTCDACSGSGTKCVSGVYKACINSCWKEDPTKNGVCNPTPTPVPVVQPGVPTVPPCVSGQTQCVNNRLRQCAANGVWGDQWAPCIGGCSSATACANGFHTCYLNGGTCNSPIACSGHVGKTGTCMTGNVCCDLGAMPKTCDNKPHLTTECLSSGTQFRMCENGNWVPYNCASGYKCPAGGSGCEAVYTCYLNGGTCNSPIACSGHVGKTGTCMTGNVCCDLGAMPKTCDGSPDGTTQCVGNDGFKQCVDGTWKPHSCATGLVCPAGGSVCVSAVPTAPSSITSGIGGTAGPGAVCLTGGAGCPSPQDGKLDNGVVCSILPRNFAANSCELCRSESHVRGLLRYCGPVPKMADGSLCSLLPATGALEVADSCQNCNSGTDHARGTNHYCGQVPQMTNGTICSILPASGVGAVADSCQNCQSGQSYARGAERFCGPLPKLPDGNVCSIIDSATDSCNNCASGKSYGMGLIKYCGVRGATNLENGVACDLLGQDISCTQCKNGSHIRFTIKYCGPTPKLADGTLCSILSSTGLLPVDDSCDYCQNGKSFNSGANRYCGEVPKMSDGTMCSIVPYGNGIGIGVLDSCDNCKSGTSHAKGLERFCGALPKLLDGTVCSIIASATDSCNNCKSGKSFARDLMNYCGVSSIVFPELADGVVCSSFPPNFAANSCELCRSESHVRGLLRYCGPVPKMADGSLCSLLPATGALEVADSCQNCSSATDHARGTNHYCGLVPKMTNGTLCSILPASGPGAVADSCQNCQSGQSYARGAERFCGPLPKLPDGNVCSIIDSATDSCKNCANGKSYGMGLMLYCGERGAKLEDGVACDLLGQDISCTQCKNGSHARFMMKYCGLVPKMPDGTICSDLPASGVLQVADSCQNCQSGKSFNSGANRYCGEVPKMPDGTICSIVPYGNGLGIGVLDSCDNCKSGTSHAKGLERFCGALPKLLDGTVCSIIASATDSCNNCKSGKSFLAGLTRYCGSGSGTTTPTSDPRDMCGTWRSDICSGTCPNGVACINNHASGSPCSCGGAGLTPGVAGRCLEGTCKQICNTTDRPTGQKCTDQGIVVGEGECCVPGVASSPTPDPNSGLNCWCDNTGCTAVGGTNGQANRCRMQEHSSMSFLYQCPLNSCGESEPTPTPDPNSGLNCWCDNTGCTAVGGANGQANRCRMQEHSSMSFLYQCPLNSCGESEPTPTTGQTGGEGCYCVGSCGLLGIGCGVRVKGLLDTQCEPDRCDGGSTTTSTPVPPTAPPATQPPQNPTNPPATAGPGPGGTTDSPAPAGCYDCPRNFECYQNKDATDYKWFVDGYAMQGYYKVEAGSQTLRERQCVLAQVTKPTFKGKDNADADCNGYVNIADYSIWRSEFKDHIKTNNRWEARFTTDPRFCKMPTDLSDFSAWRTSVFDNHNGR